MEDARATIPAFAFGGWKVQPSSSGGRCGPGGDASQRTSAPARAAFQTPEDDEPESAQAVSERLQEEGCKLAEAGRYKQALAKWDQALLLTPDCAVLFELKAQALMEEEQWWPAVRAATRATELNRQWPEGFVTLGRAQLNYGEVALAVTSLETALQLIPSNDDTTRASVQQELTQAQELLELQRQRDATEPPIDYEALTERKRRAVLLEQTEQKIPHGIGSVAAEDQGQDYRALWETVRQVGEESLRKYREKRIRDAFPSDGFVEEFDEDEEIDRD